MRTILSARDATIALGAASILENLTFSVQAGDYLGIVGPNGGGKTTLLRAALGLIPIQSGALTLFGAAPANFKDWRRIAYLPQAATLPSQRFPASVREVVAAGRIPHMGRSRRLTALDQEKIDQVLIQLHLNDIEHRMISTLSGGQFQRVCLARALVTAPELLLLDEPASALDPAYRPIFYSLLTTLNRQHGMTILLVTHDAPAIANEASRLLYLDRKIIFDGTFHAFCQSPGMTEYFGSPTQHLMCGQHAAPPQEGCAP